MTGGADFGDRCPACGAAVKAGDPWCTLCYADLRPPAPPPPLPPEPVVPPAPAYDPLVPPAPGPVVRTPDPQTAPLDAAEPTGSAPTGSAPTGSAPTGSAPTGSAPTGSAPTWPCATCGTVNRLERDVCSGCGSPFLSGLRESEGPLLELPIVGDISRLGRGQRFALAGGVVLVFIVLTLLLGLLFG